MFIRYHHVLKSRWLEGKWNHQADHLIHTLVTVMLPSYVIHHIHQELGFEGLNLANKWHKELLMQTLEMNTMCVCDLGDNKFTVQSVTNPSQIYAVNLSTQTCNYPDWPKVQLCKHVTAVIHFFRDGDLQIVPKAALPIWEGSVGPQVTETTTSILENVITISKALLNHSKLSSPETTWSLQMAESHLMAIAHCSHPSESPLLDKEDIPPNEGTWTKTTKQMGAKQQWRKPCPATISPPEPSAMHQIRELNCKKSTHEDNWPLQWWGQLQLRCSTRCTNHGPECWSTCGHCQWHGSPSASEMWPQACRNFCSVHHSWLSPPQPPLCDTPIPQLTIPECTHIPHICTGLMAIFLHCSLRVECTVLYFCQ